MASKENAFEVAIKTYLEQKAEQDPLFAPTYAKENKSIKECCEYIRQQAKKQAVGRCAVISDEEVYGWAVHYYDEDSIKVTDAPKAKVTAPTTTPAPKVAPKAPEVPKKLTKAQLKRGEDCFSMGLIFE